MKTLITIIVAAFAMSLVSCETAKGVWDTAKANVTVDTQVGPTPDGGYVAGIGAATGVAGYEVYVDGKVGVRKKAAPPATETPPVVVQSKK